jgi:hypothetical protein
MAPFPAWAQFDRARWPPSVLRQRVVRADLPDRRQVRRVGARRQGGSAGVRVEPLAIAHEIVVGSDRKVRAIRFKRPDGSVDEARGKVFVIAAHAIETPKLLLMSRCSRQRHDRRELERAGRAQSSDAARRRHGGLTKEKIYPYRGPVETSGIRELRDGSFSNLHGASGTSPSNEGWHRAIGPFKAAERYAAQGLRCHARVRGQRPPFARARDGSVGRVPGRSGQSSDARDRPARSARTAASAHRVRWGKYELDGMKVAMDYVRGLMNALGATELQTFGPSTDGAVMGGTCRMGDDPANVGGRPPLATHDHPNLYLVGSSTFPTITASPPTLTIAAFAVAYRVDDQDRAYGLARARSPSSTWCWTQATAAAWGTGNP